MNDTSKAEIVRTRERYKMRDIQMPVNDWSTNIYHPRHPLGFLFQEHNHKILIQCLNYFGWNLEPMKILDMGCGYGHWLRYLVELGANPQNLMGIDISKERILYARQKNPAIHWISFDGEKIPLYSGSLDLVLQSVVFSSILEKDLRRNLASEMLRVVKSGGHIFWLDNKNKFSSSLEGFSQSKVLQYFPDCQIIYKKAAHPRYFRFMYKHFSWLAPIIYNFTNLKCDAWLFVMRKT